MATFDDKIYGNYMPIMIYLLDFVKEPNGLVDSKKLFALLTMIGRLDLLETFTATDENGNKIKGTNIGKD